MDDGIVILVFAVGIVWLRLVLQRMEDRMTKEFDDVKSQVDRLKASVAKEVQQLADALAAALPSDPPAAMQAVADDLRALADKLDSDDGPAPAP